MFLAEVWSRVQVTWSKKMPVWHPHRQWWIWWTWRGDAVWLCRSLGVTHISHRRVGRSSVIWERTLGHLLCLPFRASAAQMHTHTHVHTHALMCTHTCARTHTCTCTHMHMSPHAHTHTHTPTYTHTGGHAQSGLRGWDLLVSQCANCFSLLSPWISQQESDVSIVQAQGGLSEAPLLGLLISIFPTLSAPQTFSLSSIHSGLPRGWARAHFSAVIYGVSPCGPP